MTDQTAPAQRAASPANANTISAIAALIGDPARANILLALMGGKALTAGELAYCASVTPQTASGHLARLVDGGLVTVEKQGRHRYHRLASASVAEAFESLSGLAATGPGPRYPRSTGPKDSAMRMARTCYDHMAGRLSVAIIESMTTRNLIILEDRSGLITDEGRNFLTGLGLDLDSKAGSSRPLCRTCMDWSERRMHLGGRLGSALLQKSLASNWVRQDKESRTLAITPKGERAFRDQFGIPVEVLMAQRSA